MTLPPNKPPPPPDVLYTKPGNAPAELIFGLLIVYLIGCAAFVAAAWSGGG